MFRKIIFVCLVAVYLVQPTEAIFGLETIVENAAAEMAINANNSTQTALAQASAVLAGVKNSSQAAADTLPARLFFAMRDVIYNEVNRTGGDLTNASTCLNQNILLIFNWQMASLKTVEGACLNMSVTEASSLVNTTSSLANNLTNTVVNANNTVATACPASGDFLGGIVNPFCRLLVLGGIFKDVAVQTARLSEYVNTAKALADSMTASASSGQTCMNDLILKLATDALPTMAPIVACAATA